MFVWFVAYGGKVICISNFKQHTSTVSLNVHHSATHTRALEDYFIDNLRTGVASCHECGARYMAILVFIGGEC